MNKFVLGRFSSTIVSIILSLSFVMSVFGITSVVILRSESFYKREVSVYSAELKEDISDELTRQMPDDKIPPAAFVDALDDGTLDFLIEKSVANIVSQNRNDYAYSDDLFNLINSSVKKYADSNGIALTSSEQSALVSLSVDVINGFITDNDITKITMFKYAQSSNSVTVMALSVVMALLCIMLLYYSNKGRHKMYSYYGMAATCAGYIEIFVPLFMLKTGMVNSFAASGYSVFDSAASAELTLLLKLQICIGIFALVAGFAILITNYRYLSKKNDRIKQQREINSKIKDEYIEHYYSKNPKPEPVDPEEKEVMKIDFE